MARGQAAAKVTESVPSQRGVTKDIPIETLRELRAKKLSYEQIAKVVGCDKANVWRRLNGFDVTLEDTEEFKSNEAFVLNNLRLRIANAINDEEIKKAPLQTKLMAYGILYDKHRLETGQSTSNTQILGAFTRLSEDEFRAKMTGSVSNKKTENVQVE
jgi:transcriptional regulator with XRE-family HTH domain